MSWIIGANIILETEQCCSCGVLFAMPQDMQKARRNDHGSFYCPNGHSQYYTAENEAQKYKHFYEQEQRQAASLRENMVAAQRAQQRAEQSIARLKKRTAAGVCPCCNRTVAQLAQHMKAKHKQFRALQGLEERKQLPETTTKVQ